MTSGTGTSSPPPFDDELADVLDTIRDRIPATIRPDMIEHVRTARAVSVETVLTDAALTHSEVSVDPGHGHPAVVLSILRRVDHGAGGPGVFYVHGGGLVAGNRFTGFDTVSDWVLELDAVAVSVEYRLAPENPYPAAFDDCCAALLWTARNAVELGFDPDRLLLCGSSAGGGLAAALALRARDAGGPALVGQALLYPMLDDRNDTVSSRQIDGIGVWDRSSNETGWDAYLGSRRGTPDVSPYAAPARADDLRDLPPTFLDVGSADVFRDEITAFADRLWAAGGRAELHVWPGAFHGFDKLAPDAELSRLAREARTSWVRRTLQPTARVAAGPEPTTGGTPQRPTWVRGPEGTPQLG